MAWFFVDSIILEAWREELDEPPIRLPRGALLEILDHWEEPAENGAKYELFWLKFTNDSRPWVVAPNWWHYKILETLPKPKPYEPPAEHVANARYRLVRVDDAAD